VPVLHGIVPIDRSRVVADVLAGLTLAAVAAPECMGYATIAGMPVVTGLYTLLLPVLAFALLGSSRHLVVGADSASAAILFAGLTSLGLAGVTPASPQWVALAGTTALMAGALLVVARLLRLGFLANFLSRTVLVGFLAGVGLQVAIGELPAMLGITVSASRTLSKLWAVVTHLGETSAATLAVAIGVLVVLVVGERFLPKMPAGLVAVVAAIVVSDAADLPSHGVAVVGHVPGGLPSLGRPEHVGSGVYGHLFGIAVSIFIIVLAQSAATSTVFAVKYDEQIDENADLVGLGVANALAGLSGTFVVNGSPTKTAVGDRAGARSQIAQLAMGVAVILILLFLTAPLSWLPEAALGAIVFRIAIGLVDWRTFAHIGRVRMDEFLVGLVTAATVVVVGVEQGIILAIVLSLIIHVRRDYQPIDAVLERTEKGTWEPGPVRPGTQSEPGLVVYRFGAGLFYANTTRFATELRALVEQAPDPVRCVIIDASPLSDVDYSAGYVLGELESRLAARGASLVFARMDPAVRRQLDRYETLPIGLSGHSPYYDHLGDAIDAFHEGRIPPPPPPRPSSGHN
jgi:high affinity sulfate transporter 1